MYSHTRLVRHDCLFPFGLGRLSPARPVSIATDALSHGTDTACDSTPHSRAMSRISTSDPLSGPKVVYPVRLSCSFPSFPPSILLPRPLSEMRTVTILSLTASISIFYLGISFAQSPTTCKSNQLDWYTSVVGVSPCTCPSFTSLGMQF